MNTDRFPTLRRAGFTLLEMIVVIAIIGGLMAVLVVSLGNSTDKATAIKCATNLKNLAAGVSSAALANDGRSPCAESVQYIDFDVSDQNGMGECYGVHKGWISYLDQNAKYPMSSPGGFSQPSLAASANDVRHALTNGAIWKAVGCNPDTYVCPAFREAARRQGVSNPGWSYHMSAYFGYDEGKGKITRTKNAGVWLSGLDRADRRLLFAEIQGLEMSLPKVRRLGVSLPQVSLGGGNGSTDMDGCLWYKEKGGNESIGFNHVDKLSVFGHVAFADGHVETLKAPADGQFVELTDWLCRGLDVVSNVKHSKDANRDEYSYQEVKNNELVGE